MAANRLAILDELSKQLPVLDEQAKKQRDAARLIQLQNEIAAAPATPAAPIAQTADTAAAALTAQKSQADLEAEAASAQKQTQIAQAQLSAEAGQAEAAAEQIRQQRAGVLSEQVNAIASLNRDLKQKLFDSQMKFEKDDRGERFATQRQLEDWALADSKDVIEAEKRWQQMDFANRRALDLLKTTYNRLATFASQAQAQTAQKLDQQQKEELLSLKTQMEEEIQRREAEAKNSMMKKQGIGMVVGAAATVGIIAATGGIGVFAAPATAAAALGAVGLGTQVGGGMAPIVADPITNMFGG